MKLKSNRYGIILAGLVVLASSFFVSSALVNKGFCFSEKRFFSEDELMKLLVEDLISKSYTESDDLINYGSVEEFYEKNPYCCTPLFTSFFDRQTDGSDSTSFNTSIYYKRYHSGEQSFSFSLGFIDPCGQKIGFDPLNHKSTYGRSSGFSRS